MFTISEHLKNDQDDMRNPTRKGFQSVPNTEDKVDESNKKFT